MNRILLITVALGLLISARTLADTSKPEVGDTFQIESVAHAGQLLRVEDARSADGTPMVLYPQQAWRCMTWELQADGAGVRMKNLFTRKTLAPTTKPTDAKEDSPAPVTQRPLAKTPMAAEAWQFVPVEGKSGVFQIKHSETGLMLEATDDGKVVAKKPSDAVAQQWKLLNKPERFTG